MQLKKRDIIKLNKEVFELSQRGVFVGCEGIIFEQEGNFFRVLFLNAKNYGDYIFATVNGENLSFIGELTNDIFVELTEYIKFNHIDEEKTFKKNDVKEYDQIEIVVEKPEYTEHGVHKGMRGVVMSNYAIQDAWYVIFSEKDTGKDIADICVKREDFKII